jgi:hypothetical protein
LRVIVAGSREITDYNEVVNAIQASGYYITKLVSGGCRGVDGLGEIWAENQEPPVPVKSFPARWGYWRRRGKTWYAGHERNQQMADYAEALIAVWDGASTGTADMIRRAKARGLLVYVHHVPDHVQDSSTTSVG